MEMGMEGNQIMIQITAEMEGEGVVFHTIITITTAEITMAVEIRIHTTT